MKLIDQNSSSGATLLQTNRNYYILKHIQSGDFLHVQSGCGFEVLKKSNDLQDELQFRFSCKFENIDNAVNTA